MSTTKVINNGVTRHCSKQITTILFDLDNTLIPTRKGDTKAIKKLCEIIQEKYYVPKELAANSGSSFLSAFRRCPDNPKVPLDTWRTHLWNESLPDQFKHLSQDIYQIWLSLRYQYVTLLPETINLLQFLRQYFLLAIITNGPTNAQHEKVQILNLHRYFDTILVSGDLPWEKPHEAIFLAACKWLDVKPHQCMMIGDKLETDIQGGIQAKLGATVWIPRKTDEDLRAELEIYPDYVITNLQELESLLPLGQRQPRTTSSRSSTKRGRIMSRRDISSPEIESGNSNASDGS